MPSRSRVLRLTPSASLSVELTLNNLEEDAYWVRLRLSFPRGLSFRKVEMLKVNKKVDAHIRALAPCSFCPPGSLR